MNDVQLYLQPETDEPALLQRARALLTADEIVRADRFVFAQDRALFTVAHALLRRVLGPGELETGKRGRPELKDRRVRFNLSHTRGLIAVAVTRSADIGVDVEDMQRRSDGTSVADRFFSPIETAALFALPQAEQPERFFRYWTLKEAYIKARGLGLAIPLDQFSFAFDPLRIAFDGINDKPQRWAFHQEPVGERHMLALCIEAPLGRIDRVDVAL